MPWFKVDDGFHGHPKVFELSLGAVGLWTLAGSWCAKYLTDGYVPTKTVNRLGGDAEMAHELHLADLWENADGGWQFKDWADYQPLKEDVEAERAAAQERMKRVRAAKKGVRPNEARTDAERSPEHGANIARSSEEVRVTPSQSQSHPDPSSSKKRRSAASGTRLDPSWIPSEESRSLMASEAPDIDLRAEHRVFVDYWIAQPGQKGVRTNWESTWRNWMRKNQKDHNARRGPAQSRTEQNMSIVAKFAAQEAQEQRGLTA